MPFNFFQTKFFKVVIVVALCVAVIVLSPVKFFAPFRSALFFIFSPIQKVAFTTAHEFVSIKDFLSSIGKLKKENEQLLKENNELLAKKSEMEEIGRQNEMLRQELNLLPREKFNLIGARVISQDFYGQGDWIEIDRGTKDGVEKEMPIIIDSGALVGIVGEAYPTASKVLLVNNTESSINVVDSETDSKGIVKGEYGLGIILDMVLQSEGLNKGDKVITSGIGKGLPRGLLVGTVSDIGASADKLFKRAIISSPVDFSKLQFVFIIKGNK